MDSSLPTLKEWELQELVEFVRLHRPVVLSGAGLSTASGIPDYRGPETRKRKRNPVQYREFLESEANRSRYWGRSALGWPRFSKALPNEGHLALAQLEEEGWLRGIITQNVDRLHHKAGSREVVELHGALAEVRCLECEILEDRDSFQERLLLLNPGWDQQEVSLAPDGDAEVASGRTASFQIPPCQRCGGVLKPDVVFFGESVRPEVLESAWSLLQGSEGLLVLGSSLTVYSGYRFVRRAREWNLPVGILNVGETRGDKDATARWSGDVTRALKELYQRMT